MTVFLGCQKDLLKSDPLSINPDLATQTNPKGRIPTISIEEAKAWYQSQRIIVSAHLFPDSLNILSDVNP